MPANKKVLFINGIGNQFDDFKGSLLHLANLTGYNVEGVFCPTFGAVTDALNYKRSLLDHEAYEGVRELQRHMTEFHKNSPAGATMMIIPHSRGAVYARNALLDSPPEVRARAEVRAIAPGGYVHKDICKSTRHVESRSCDVVPWLDMKGRWRCQDTIVTLERHPAAPYFDHSFNSPTYQQSLRREIKGYITR